MATEQEEPQNPTLSNDVEIDQKTLTDSADNVESNWDEVVDSFDDMNLKDELLRGKFFFFFFV
jgi:hypothetical protein